MLHLNKKKGISVAALSVAAIVIVTLASVITISLTGNYNDAKKIELAQELNMIQLSVDNYYYENGTYPVSNQQLTISNLSDKVKQTQFSSEEDINGDYTFSVIDFALIQISSLKYGNGMEGTYDLYVVSTSTGKVYYAKGVKIGNETYHTLNNELNGLLTGNNKLDINSDSAILFSEAKLDNGSVSVKISVPTSYEINSVKFEDKDIELTSQNEDYYIYYVEADEVGTINVNYNYNSDSRNANYTIVEEPNIQDSEPVY